MKKCIVLVSLGFLVFGCTSSDTQPPSLDSGADIQIADTGPTAEITDDVGSEEVSPTETIATDETSSGDCEAGTGCFGELCEGNGDCQSGICLPHMGDMVCSNFCIDECPQGWNCVSISLPGSDLTFACVSNFTHLCRPCTNDGECSSDQSSNVCVGYGSDGGFCGSPCSQDSECPERFVCEETTSITGATSNQCISEEGVCECSATSVQLGLLTNCSRTNEHGTCQGNRVCTEDGLTDCDAPDAIEESCNGFDDNCDGAIDEDTCDDGNPCTEDVCGGEAGCMYTPLSGIACDDQDACSEIDQCIDGTCSGVTIECEDGNSCTDDLCFPLTGCVFEPNTLACDDGADCTVGDTCKEGECTAGVEIACNDGNPCTDDACTAAGGCLYTPNTEPCNDQNQCTLNDVCADGVCTSDAILECNDFEPCTTDYCAPDVGCLTAVNTAPCDDDNACTLGDICADGGCTGGANTMNCDDGNPCTDDICDAEGACLHLPTDAVCNDNNECTEFDTCQEGFCVGTGPLMCSDGNPCTYDFCLPGGGCQHDNVVGPCSDGDNCTFDDFCSGGTCIGGVIKSCDDGNPCTDDICNATADCEFIPNSQPCDDENACTNEDTCSDGTCVGSGSPDCDDGDICTTNTCDPAVGCALDYNTNPCNDENPCTLTDACVDGTCLGSGDLDCDDGDHCTADSCDPVEGCVSVPAESCCGNSVLEGDEECDDGNLENLDGCTSLCTDEHLVIFNYTGGTQTWTVPAGITQVVIEVWGAQGGGSLCCSGTQPDDGGQGGYATGTLAVTAGEVLRIYVGQQGDFGNPVSAGGWNGGGGGGHYGGGGGGATDVRKGGTDCLDRVIVAGGGGGGNCGCPDHGHGGNGGGTNGASGLSFTGWTPAGGGTQSNGGSPGSNGSSGSFCAGSSHAGSYHFAGGGGGWYGGGAAYAAGGGGGSGYIGGVTVGSTSTGGHSGNGQVQFTW